ncbi:hypothetical protein [Roseobacter sp. HKCCA0434]|uniref:hypothetical protein n=1 Tax=Roseobacter sp. HKCCA0434 TaxID=3079297 RepID=UPI0029058C0A|nr:hypothetical protein [Roseobacter sp. HKCCA0434]
MKRVHTYPDLFTHRRESVLPETVQRLTHDLGMAVQSRTVSPTLVSAFRAALRDVPAEAVPRAAAEIRDVGQMFAWHLDTKTTGAESQLLHMIGLARKTPDSLLREHPDLGWFFMFHGSGYLRQAAMEALPTSPDSPFEVAAVVYRMNDWVENVRAASRVYAKKFLPSSDARTISEAAFFLIHQATLFGRWTDTSRSVVLENIYREDVLARLKEQFLAARSGKIGRSLSLILRRSDFDGYLRDLVMDADSPIVRAIAADTLLTKRARWHVGHRREWVNKALGVARRVPTFESRVVTIDIPVMDVLTAAMNDKSAQVRRTAADYLVANRYSLTPEMMVFRDRLSTDKSPAIRFRMDFLNRSLAES